MIDKTRQVALKVLYKIDKENSYSNIALDEILKQNRKQESTNKLDSRDIGLVSELVYGTTAWKLTLDEVIKKYSSIKIKKISTWILNILRMGIYQIIFLDKIPKSAAVNESVNLAKRYGHKSSSNFVNAILRKVDKKDYEELFDIENDIERISKTTSTPIWIVEKLFEDLKENKDVVKEVNEICKSSNYRPKTSIRVNSIKTNKEELKKILKQKDIETKDGLLKDFLIVDKIKNIEENEEFYKGLYTVQDEVAGLVPIILDPKPNQKVLDACSSPGGKTTYMAQIMENEGIIEAWDIHKHRVKLVRDNYERLDLKIIKEKVKDATIYDEKYLEYFDKILLDVPCLGIGVLKRKPDIKWQKKPEDLKEIVELQEKILDICSKYLKKGGDLVYSTCSILKEENENIINKFLVNNKEFQIEKNIINQIGKNNEFFKKYIKNDKYIQVFQNEKTDGFFICKLRKI